MASRAGSKAEANERARRKFARRQWARRWLVWRRIVALLVIVGLVGGALWALYWSSWLVVQQVEVTGVRDTLRPSQVRDVADVPTGEPLARVDLAAVQRRVQGMAAVESAEVSRVWPDGILIEVTERTAIAVVELDGRLQGMDATGVLFREYDRAPTGLPRVQIATQATRDARQEAARVLAALPEDLARTVDHVEVTTIDQISLVLRDRRTVLWGSAEQSAQKAKVLAVLLQRRAQTYDVSVPSQPTTR